MPRGGGAFLAEVDGNLTVWKDDAGIVTLHHAGKIRGPGFDAIRFELVSLQLDGRVDCRGRPIYSVAAKHLLDERAEQLEAKAMDDENRILIAMQKKPGGSVADLAMAAGMTSGVGAPQKSKVARLLIELGTQGLAKKGRTGVWTLNRHIAQVIGTGSGDMLQAMLDAGHSTYAIAAAMGTTKQTLDALLAGPDPFPAPATYVPTSTQN